VSSLVNALGCMYYFLISHTIGSPDLLPFSPAQHFKIFHVFLTYFPVCLNFSTIQSYAPNVAFESFLLYLKSSLLVQRVFFLLNASSAMAVLDIISRVHLVSFVIMILKYLKYFTFSSYFWFIITCTGNDSL
jgi:hypothetical protein